MSDKFQFGWLSDARLAAHALSPTPVWLWAADTQRILWANSVAAAIFDAPSPVAAAAIEFEPTHSAVAQIARLSATLPQGGAPRLERLRGFGASFGGTLICLCSRVTLADTSNAILVVSTERAGKDLALPERAHGVLADLALPAAIFTADGELIDMRAEARERLGDKRDLVALGAETLARETTLNGSAEGELAAGSVAMVRLGAGPTMTLLVVFTGPARPARVEEPVKEPAPIVSPPTVPNPAAADTRVRRMPLRFVWQMDAATCFTLGAQDFTKLIGPKTASVLDRPWAEIAATLKLDPEGKVAQALAARETWSGIVVMWPVDGTDERVPIEMSGLPVFDRDRRFLGFRGFGVCRDTDRLAALAQRAAAPPIPVLTLVKSKPERPEPEKPEAKVLPFPAPPAHVEKTPPPPPAPEPPVMQAPSLSPVEHSAFQELARELTERLKNPAAKGNADLPPVVVDEPFVAPVPPEPPRPARNGDAARDTQEGRPILDRLPVGILVYRLNNLVYANRAFLDWTGYATLEALTEAGGLDSLFIETKDAPTPPDPKNGGKNGTRSLTITTINGKQRPVEGRLFTVAWSGENALVLMINTQAIADDHGKAMDASLRRLEEENHELKAVLDTATDGVLVLDRAGRVLSANRSAEALFGYEAAHFTELSFGDLFAPESRRAMLDHLDRLSREARRLGAAVHHHGAHRGQR
jgi:PAS domain-containing protein